MKFIVALFALLALTLPAQAQVNLEDLQVRRRGADLDVKVSILNAGSSPVEGIRLILYVRPNPQSIWELTKIWSNIGRLRPGLRSTRDFFDGGNPHLRQIASYPAFEARVTVDYPGGQHQEKFATFSGESH